MGISTHPDDFLKDSWTLFNEKNEDSTEEYLVPRWQKGPPPPRSGFTRKPERTGTPFRFLRPPERRSGFPCEKLNCWRRRRKLLLVYACLVIFTFEKREIFSNFFFHQIGVPPFLPEKHFFPDRRTTFFLKKKGGIYRLKITLYPTLPGGGTSWYESIPITFVWSKLQ